MGLRYSTDDAFVVFYVKTTSRKAVASTIKAEMLPCESEVPSDAVPRTDKTLPTSETNMGTGGIQSAAGARELKDEGPQRPAVFSEDKEDEQAPAVN